MPTRVRVYMGALCACTCRHVCVCVDGCPHNARTWVHACARMCLLWYFKPSIKRHIMRHMDIYTRISYKKGFLSC